MAVPFHNHKGIQIPAVRAVHGYCEIVYVILFRASKPRWIIRGLHTSSSIPHSVTWNDRHSVLNYRLIKWLFNSFFRVPTNKHQRSALLSLCESNPPVTGGLLTQGTLTLKPFPVGDITIRNKIPWNIFTVSIYNLSNNIHILNKQKLLSSNLLVVCEI